MAGLIAKALRRADDVYAPAIRAHLSDGNPAGALAEAIGYLRSEARKFRGYRPGDAAISDTELAASILVTASMLHQHKPSRPAGCPSFPQPADLLAIFDTALAEALKGGGTDG